MGKTLLPKWIRRLLVGSVDGSVGGDWALGVEAALLLTLTLIIVSTVSKLCFSCYLVSLQLFLSLLFFALLFLLNRIASLHVIIGQQSGLG